MHSPRPETFRQRLAHSQIHTRQLQPFQQTAVYVCGSTLLNACRCRIEFIVPTMSKPSFWLRLDLRFCEVDRNRYWRRDPDNVNVAALFCFKSVMQKSLAANHRDLPLHFCAEQARIRSTRLLPEPVSPRPSQHIVRKWRHRHSMPFATRLAAQSSAANAVADLGPSQTATVGNVAQIPAIKLSTEMAKAFKESFAALQHEVDWLADSPRFAQKARATLDSTCDRSVLQQLSDFTRNPNAPSALLLTGLPREDTLPPTIGETPIPKVVETVYKTLPQVCFG